MNCPKCSYPNPQGVTYCQMCYEVFNRSAADRYYHAQKRARRDRGEKESKPTPPPTPSPTPPLNTPVQILSETETLPRIDWDGLLKRMFDTLINLAQVLFRTARSYPKEIGLSVGIIVLGVLTLFYASPTRRLELFGNRLEYRFPPKSTVSYLVGFHTEVKSWSERGGRLDTPLDNLQKDEMGTVLVKASPFKIDLQISPFHQQIQKIEIHPHEWILNQVGALSQNIALNHPSLKSSKVILDRKGVVLKREANMSTRIGRAANLLIPQWPAGIHRSGNQWDEPIGWVETLGDWKIFWRGHLHWELAGYESHGNTTYIRLHYHAEVAPGLWETPSWAKGTVRTASFNGTGEGDLLFDVRAHQVISNIFTQEGALTIPIANIYRIPIEERVGRLPRRRWGARVAAAPGTLVIQMKERIDIRKT